MARTSARRPARAAIPFVLSSLALLVGGAAAQEPATTPPAAEPSLSDRVEALEREVQALREGAPEAPNAPLPLERHIWPEVRVTGFFQLDAGYYLQDARNQALLGDIPDTLDFRRARLAAAGKVAPDVSYIMEFDAANGQARFVDVWMQLDRTPLGKLRVGRFRQPFGMDELTSVRELAFHERSSMFALAPFRQTGAQLVDTALDQRFTWAIAGYRYNSDPLGNVFTDSGGYGMAARATGLLLDDGDRVVHLGVDYSHNDPGNQTVRFAYQNEFFGGATTATPGTVPFFVDTGALTVSHTDLFDVEAAYGSGPVVVQAEARLARVAQPGGQQEFHSAYAQVRWVVTGETIPYVRGGGVFGRVVPQKNAFAGGIGAIELAARVSQIDLDSKTSGRRLLATTVGCNWYLNRFTRLQVDWVHDELTDRTIGDSTCDTFGLRAQIDF